LGALGILLGCALSVSTPSAPAFEDIRALAREKAAAVAILKHKAANQVATLVNDRVFVAYLNATTQGEGARIRTRMSAMLTTLVDRFGVREAVLVDRSGELVVRAGKGDAAASDIAGDPSVKARFAQNQTGVATTVARGGLTHAAPVVWRDQAEFVLRVRQSLDAYRKALRRGVDDARFVVLLDEKGAVLSDTRVASVGGRDRPVAGLTLDGLRKAVKGTPNEGAGEVTRGSDRYKISYEAVDSWTVVAVETSQVAAKCTKGAKPPCG